MRTDGLPDEMWDALVRAGERRRYRAEGVIFLAHDPPGPVIAVLEGEVRVETQTGPLPTGTFGPGAVIGEIAALDGLPRTASIVATTPTEVVAVDAVTFNDLLLAHPPLALWVLRQMAARLRANAEVRVSPAPNATVRRVAAIVAEHTRARGRAVGAFLQLDVAHNELLADDAGEPEETVAPLTYLQANGWLVASGESLFVVNLPALEAVAAVPTEA